MDIDDKIRSYIAKHEKFKELLTELRKIIRKYPFEETLKWGMPTYVYDHKNLIGIGAFKNHVAIWFFQGALLKDKENLLHNAQEGKTKAMRHIHFKEIGDLNESFINQYLQETIDNQRNGLTVQIIKPVKKGPLPVELSNLLKEDASIADSFSRLTAGRKQEYAVYISSAKRAQTKSDRLKKITPLILEGKGLNDKYKRD
jgi:uncharacterized protein YdeI (YjbR/CyaY-like superfamily)